ncbi:MAG: hypothetical protein WCH11_07360, partial [Bdellovibrio sp.]
MISDLSYRVESVPAVLKLFNWRLASPPPLLAAWQWSWDQIEEAQSLGQVWILSSQEGLRALGVGRRAGSIF